jgi:hypothetical protein
MNNKYRIIDNCKGIWVRVENDDRESFRIKVVGDCREGESI